MPEIGNCENCIYFHQMRSLCQRFPPTVYHVAESDHEFGEDVSRFPFVDLMEWCGEYKKIVKVKM